MNTGGTCGSGDGPVGGCRIESLHVRICSLALVTLICRDGRWPRVGRLGGILGDGTFPLAYILFGDGI